MDNHTEQLTGIQQAALAQERQGELTPFILRGRAGPALRTASVLADPGFPLARGGLTTEELTAEHHLLVVKGPSGFLIENLNFDASSSRGQRAFGCLRLERADFGTSAQLSRVRRCVFENGIVNLVQIGEFSDPSQLSVDLGGGQDLLGLAFEGCRFQQQLPNRGTSQLPPDYAVLAAQHHWIRDGVYVRANNSLRMRFVDCFWNGMMRAGIRTYSGSITISNCNFHLSRMPVPRAVCLSQNGRYGGEEGQSYGAFDVHSTIYGFVDARDNGCDIYVEYLLGTPPSGMGRAIGASGGVAVYGCESQSWRSLSSYPITAATRDANHPAYDCYIHDAHVTNATGLIAAMAEEDTTRGHVVLAPPGIEWLGPFSVGSSLTVSGLQAVNHPNRRGNFENNPLNNVYFTPWSGRVIIGVMEGYSPRIVNLGSRTGLGVAESGAVGRDLFYKVATSVNGPQNISDPAPEPWFLDLVVPPRLIPG